LRQVSAPTQAPASDISILESLLRGGAQGATLGFADELTGVTEAALNPESYTDLDQAMANYRQSRDESREAFKAAEMANPKSYMGGNVAGAIATSIVPAAGIAKGGASLARLVGQGAAVGGAAGLGESQADLTQGEIGGAATDALTGAAIGAGTTAVVGGLAKAGKGAVNILKNKDAVQDAADIYKLAKRGEQIGGEDVLRGINETQMDIAGDVIQQAQARKGEMGNMYKQFYATTRLDNPQATRDALSKLRENVLEASRNPVIKEQRNGLLKYLEQELLNPNIDSRRLGEIKNELEMLSSDAFKGNNQQFMQQFNSLMEKANPNYFGKLNDINAQYADYMELLGGLKTSTGEAYSTAMNKDANAKEALRQLFNKSTDMTTQGYNKLQRLSEQSPMLKESMPNIQDLTRRQELNKTLAEGGVKGTMADVAEATGRTVGAMTNSDMMRKMAMVADKLGANSPLAQKIRGYMTSPDAAAKGYFIMQQQPWFRQLLKEDGG
jgi:hypothetical protein